MTIAGLATDASGQGLRLASDDADAVGQDAAVERDFASTLEADMSGPGGDSKHPKRSSNRPKLPDGSQTAVAAVDVRRVVDTNATVSLPSTSGSVEPLAASVPGAGVAEIDSGVPVTSDPEPIPQAAPPTLDSVQESRSRAENAPPLADSSGAGAPDVSQSLSLNGIPLSAQSTLDASGGAPTTQAGSNTPNPSAGRARAAYGAPQEARLVGAGRLSSSDSGSAEAGAAQLLTAVGSGSQVAPLTGANDVTGVNAPSQSMAAGRGRLHQAAMSASNQAILRRGASGEINHPELGRVVVRAQNRGNAVDVEVQADRGETHGLLHASAVELANDLRDGDVPLGLLSIHVDGSGMGGAGAAGRQGGGSSDKSRERSDSESNNDENDRPGARMRRRVRIVL